MYCFDGSDFPNMINVIFATIVATLGKGQDRHQAIGIHSVGHIFIYIGSVSQRNIDEKINKW